MRKLQKELEEGDSKLSPIAIIDFQVCAAKCVIPAFEKHNRLCSPANNRDSSLNYSLYSLK